MGLSGQDKRCRENQDDCKNTQFVKHVPVCGYELTVQSQAQRDDELNLEVSKKRRKIGSVT